MFMLHSYWLLYLRSFFDRYLENEGIEYLRTYLHLPSEIVPSTLKRATRSEPSRARPSAPTRADNSKTGEDRSAYRRAPGGAGGLDKKGDVGAGAADVEFVSDHLFANIYFNNILIQCVLFSFSVVDSVVDQDLNKHFFLLVLNV